MKQPLYASLKWRELREKQLWLQPYCSLCKSTFNLQVDHIVEHKDRDELFWNINNLQTLCCNCHAKKSNLEYTIINLNQGDYILYLKDETNKELIKYLEYFNDIHLAIRTYCKELTRNNISIVLNIKGLDLNVVRELVSYLVINIRLKPKRLEVDSTNKYYSLLKELKI